jgi:hypothetical protein
MKRAAIRALAMLLAMSAGAASVNIPKPHEPLAPPPPAPALEPSVMELPVTISVDTLAAAVAKGFPAQMAQDKKWLGGGDLVGKPEFEYQFYLWRGNPKLRMSDGQVEVSFPEMKYRVKGHVEADGPEAGCGYGEPMKRLRLTATSKISWAPDGTPASKTTFAEPEFVDPCKMDLFGVDATPILKKALEEKLPELSKSLDAALRRQALSQKRLASLWQQLATPTELAPGLWIAFNPTGLEVAPIAAAGEKSLKTHLSIDVQPSATTGQKPAAAATALPALKTASPSAAAFHVALPIRIAYASLNQKLRKQIVGTQFDAGPLGPVKINSTYLYGSGDKLILQLDVEGGVNGRVYTIGKPVFDPATAVLGMQGFDLTIDTKNILARAANSLAKGKLVEAVEPETKTNLKDRIEHFRRAIEAKLNRQIIPGVWMKAWSVRFDPKGVYTAPGGIVVQVAADAKVGLAVR